MAYGAVTLPLTGSGDATAQQAVDLIDSKAYQAIKLIDGTEGSTLPVAAKGTTPGATDAGLIVRPIGSTGFTQAIVPSSQLTVTVGNPTTAVTVSNPTTSVSLSSVHTVTVGNPTTAVNVANQPTVDLSSAGSTRLVGRVDVNNPTTSVTLTNPTTLVDQGAPAGSSTSAWWVRTVTTGSAGGSTTVDLGTGGSTRLAGRVTVDNPTTAVTVSSGLVLGPSTAAIGSVAQGGPAGTSTDAWWVRTVTTGSAGGSTTVDLGSGGSTRVIGLISSGTQTIGTVNQGAPAGSSTDAWWVRSVTTGSAGGSTTVDLGSGGSTNLVGLVEGTPYTTGQLARTTVNSSLDASLFAANANRKGICIANGSTGTALLVSLNSTVAVTSGGSYSFQVPALGFVYMGGQVGQLPNFTGLARGKMNSTAVAGPVFITEYT